MSWSEVAKMKDFVGVKSIQKGYVEKQNNGNPDVNKLSIAISNIDASKAILLIDGKTTDSYKSATNIGTEDATMQQYKYVLTDNTIDIYSFALTNTTKNGTTTVYGYYNFAPFTWQVIEFY